MKLQYKKYLRGRWALWVSMMLALINVSSARAITCPDNTPCSIEMIVSYGGMGYSTTVDNEMTLTIGQTLAGEMGGTTVYGYGLGFWARLLLEPAPPIVTATDGDYPDKIVVGWRQDGLSPAAQEGYKVYREGSLLATVGFTVDEYQDFNILAGQFYKYEVRGINEYGASNPGDDIGFVNPNGVITGKIDTENGRPIADANVTLTPLVGRAMTFDGADDYVTMGDKTGLNFNRTNPYTLEAWFKTSSSDSMAILSKMDASANLTGYDLFMAGGKINAHLINSWSSKAIRVETQSGGYNNGQWHHVAVTYSGNSIASGFLIYVDGASVPITAMNNSLTDTTTNSAAFNIGARDEADNFFVGSIDEVRVWNIVRSADQIKTYKDRTLTGKESGLLGYWQFNEGLSDKVFDLTANNNDGTAKNGPTWTTNMPAVYLVGTTDENGDYMIGGINYGSGTTFTATPSKATEINSYSLLLDGTNDFVEVPHDTLQHPPHSFTLEMWARRTVSGSGEKILAGKYDLDGGALNGYVLRYDDSVNRIEAELGDGNVSYALNGTAWNLNQWYHVALVYSGPDDSLWLYVDGARKSATAPTGLAYGLNPTDSNLRFGASPTGASGFFKGHLDEIRLWKMAHSQPEIAARMNNILSADEVGLVAYWQCNEGSGDMLMDMADDGNIATLPMNGALINTDEAGAATVWSPLSKNAETVVHTFSPETRILTLTPSNTAINNVDFMDQTLIAVTGFVRYNNTRCFAKDVEILVDGVSYIPPVKTDANGYFVAEFEPGTSHILTPFYGDHNFIPANWEIVNIISPVAGLVFKDQTVRALHLDIFGGPEGCKSPIIPSAGKIVVTYQSTPSCFTLTDTLDTGVRLTRTDLPPLNYNITVQHPAPGVAMDGITVSLRDSTNLTRSMAYRKTMQIAVSGLPASACPAGYNSPFGEAMADFPVLKQLDQTYSIDVAAQESYVEFVGGTVCDLDTGMVDIYNYIADNDPTAPDQVPFKDGHLVEPYTFKAGRPNFAGGGLFPYTKTLEVTVRELVANPDTTTNEETPLINGRIGTGLARAYVTGIRKREGGFTTLMQNPILPLYILRDPPGDASFAGIAKETSFSTRYSISFSNGVDASLDFKFGGGTTVSTCGGIGVAVCTMTLDTESSVTVHAADITYEAVTQKEMQITATFAEEFSTLAEEYRVGGGADLYVGFGSNIRITEADELKLTGCNFSIATAIAADSLGIESMYLYTDSYIRNYLLPGLNELLTAFRDSVLAGQTHLAADTLRYFKSVKNWTAIVDTNAALKAKAVQDPARLKHSLSFDSNFGGYTITNTRDTTRAVTYEHTISNAHGVDIETDIKIIFFYVGTNITAMYRHSQTFMGLLDDPIFGSTPGGFDTTTVRTTSVTLADNDPDDFFWVQIYDDGVYGNVYKLVGGATSCPWEPGTLPREGVQLSMTGSTSGGFNEVNIPPDQAAIYTLNLANTGQTFEDWYYNVSVSQDVNPHGAIISINGMDPAAIMGVLILGAFGENTLQMMMTVERGPLAYEYDDLEIGLESGCEVVIWEGKLATTVQCGPGGGEPGPTCAHKFQDLTSFDVHFLRPCSEVKITSPGNDWLVDGNAPSDTVWVNVAGYDRANTDFARLKLQYRPITSARATGQGGPSSIPMSATDTKHQKAALADEMVVTAMDESFISVQAVKPNPQIFESLPANIDRPMLHMARKDGSTYWLPVETPDEAEMRMANDTAEAQSGWITFHTIERTAIPASPNYMLLPWATGDLDDGQYELRAMTECVNLDNPRGYSTLLSGALERRPPQVQGQPQPADGVLSSGDAISVTFNEPVDCMAIAAIDDLELIDTVTGNNVVYDWTCADGQIYFTIAMSNNIYYEGHALRATVSGIADQAGNTITEPIEWEFYVDRNPVRWSGGDITAEQYPDEPQTITRQLVNNGGTVMSFDFTDLAPNPGRLAIQPAGWMTITPDSGVVHPGSAQTITIRFSEAMNGGAYKDTLFVRTSQGDEAMRIDLQVMCRPPAWTATATQYQYSMTVTGAIAGLTPRLTTVVGAFVGSQPRGMAQLVRETTFNDTLFYLTVFSNVQSGESVTLRAYDSWNCRELGQVYNAFSFQADSNLGRPNAPFLINPTQQVAKSYSFTNGWNWFSLNMALADMELNAAFGGTAFSSSDLIKSQSQFSQYVAGTGWIGSLATLSNSVMYMVKLANPTAWEWVGYPITLPASSIPLVSGWNWIAYQPPNAINVNTALASLTNAMTGDLIKGQTTFAQFVAGAGWFGSLTTLQPGSGYQIKVINPGMLTYPTPPSAAIIDEPGDDKEAARTLALVTDDGRINLPLQTSWQFDPAQFEHNMTVTGVAKFEGREATSDFSVIGAFVGGECRGIAEPVYIESLQKSFVFLMIYSNQASGETVEFRLLKNGEQTEYFADENVSFQSNQSLGGIEAPFAWTSAPLDIEAPNVAVPTHFALSQNTPNPFSALTTIQYALPTTANVEITIYNVAGQKVRTLVNGKQAAGYRSVNWDGANEAGERLQSGVYFYRLKTDAGFEETRKLLLVK